jgi:chloramphenicol-sensitive protein RarD
MAADLGHFPWIALTLAFSFGFYGLIKKMGNLDSIASLSAETLFVLPAAVLILIFKEVNGSGSILSSTVHINLLLAGTGVISVVPLFCFAQGAKLIPLSRVGFFQYIAPTMMLLIGVLVYGESFTFTHAVSFSLIWSALILYTFSILKQRS